jgi:transcriptional regulator with GAF, ATPase, and Fis domain
VSTQSPSGSADAPFSLDGNAESELNRLQRQNLYLREEIKSEHDFEKIIGTSPALRATLATVAQVAPTDSTVLVLGETGTGKELIARAIHDLSRRRDEPLIKLSCASLDRGSIESELFGREKGAFAGTVERRVGRFALADGGTIFLDEIGAISLDVQARLLRVLQERELEPVGSSKTVKVDVRVIAATNRDLQNGVTQGTFRSDLFDRLNVMRVHVPPLRDRRDDIALLVHYFVEKYAAKVGRRIDSVSPASLDLLCRYAWPGNVRELENVVERAVILSPGAELEVDPQALRMPASGGAFSIGALELASGEVQGAAPSTAGEYAAGAIAAPSATDRYATGARSAAAQQVFTTLDEWQRRHIVRTLDQCRWVIEGAAGAAAALGMRPSTLRSRMKKLGVRRERQPV